MANTDRKAEIRKAAAAVFAEKGYDRSSIRDVAKAARMSLAGLYYYYRGKEEILFDIQNQAFETLLNHHAEALAGVREPKKKLSRDMTFISEMLAAKNSRWAWMMFASFFLGSRTPARASA